jgi:hypothetical protein
MQDEHGSRGWFYGIGMEASGSQHQERVDRKVKIFPSYAGISRYPMAQVQFQAFVVVQADAVVLAEALLEGLYRSAWTQIILFETKHKSCIGR